MKRPYLNAVYTNLILQRDYQPVKQVPPPVDYQAPDIMVLQRYRNEVFFLIQLLDGDMLSPADIEAKLTTDYDMLLQNNTNQILHIVDVLVFNETPSLDTIAAIDNGLKNKNVAKRYISCYTVDLSGKAVSRQSELSLNTDGIDKLLKNQLNIDPAEFEALPDIESLLAVREKEYTIDLKVKKPTLTHALIGINIAVWLFILGYASLYNLDYNKLNIFFGAKVNELISNGQYWRLISPIFLHAGPLPIHLLVNCYSLYILGNIVERIFGHKKFALIYFIAGIYGNIASFIFINFPGVGASGAIFGLFGALIYFGVEEPKIFKKYFGYSVIVTIIINILITFSIPGIDYTAHLGGMAGGFLTAYAVKVNDDPEKSTSRLLMLLGVLFIAAVAFYYGLNRYGSMSYI